MVQACKRKAKKLPNMVKLIQEDKSAESIYRQLLCLPLLPPDRIVSAFEIIKLRAMALNADAFRQLLRYYNAQWLHKVSSFFKN